MLLRARTIKAWNLVPGVLLGGYARSPNASTPNITVTNILVADGKGYDTVAAVEGTAVGVCPDQKVVAFTKSYAKESPNRRRRRRQDR